MTRTINLGLLLSLFVFGLKAQELSTEDKLTLYHTVDSIISSYEQFSCLTENTTSFSDHYAELLKGLFAEGGEAKIPFDLPLDPSKKEVKLNDYISLVKTALPSGLDVLVKSVHKGDITPDGDTYVIQATFNKNILAIYNDVQRFDHVVRLSMILQINNDFTDAKILSLDKAVERAKPDSPEGLSGRKDVEAGQKGVFYSVEAAPGVDYYTWQLPSGWKGQSTLNTIFIDFGSEAESGEIRVVAHNDKGASAPSTLALNVTGGTPLSKPEPHKPVSEEKSKWFVMGDGGVLTLPTDVKPSIEARGFLQYQAKMLNENLSLNVKAGAGAAYYTYSFKNNAGTETDYYMSTFEVPVMAGLRNTWGAWALEANTGASVILPLASTQNEELTFGWISDAQASYTFNFWDKNLAIYAGVRYHMLFGINDTQNQEYTVGALGAHGGLRFNTSILKLLKK